MADGIRERWQAARSKRDSWRGRATRHAGLPDRFRRSGMVRTDKSAPEAWRWHGVGSKRLPLPVAVAGNLRDARLPVVWLRLHGCRRAVEQLSRHGAGESPGNDKDAPE